MIMEHTDASQTRAAQRYLLGEMSVAERDDFEDHFFSCSECAEAVRVGVAFGDSAREVFREQPHLGRRGRAEGERTSRWWQRLKLPVLAPAFAALMFLCVAGYERTVISRLQGKSGRSEGVQSLPVFGIKPVFRSPAEQTIAVPTDAAEFSLRFDGPEGVTAPICEIRDSSGVVRSALHAAESPSGEVQLLLSRSQFPAGRYTLSVRGEGQSSGEPLEYTYQLAYP